MLRSMYSGISGMKANQTKMDVIGNNISNVGTTAFKSSTAKFQDMLSQNVREATAPTMNQGGLNANQVGLGVQLSSIDTVMKQGMLQTTGRNLDVAIDGDGFFMVERGPQILGDNVLQVSHKKGSHNVTEQSLSNSGAEILYSRDGSFMLDESGNLLTSDGYRVLGYPLTNDDNLQAPTGKEPNTISAGGFDFKFGPGTQLNGYKVILGSVGPATKTSAEALVNDKTIILNGDFSETSSLNNIEAEAAINKALSTAGISQRINVFGKPLSFTGLATDKVGGGSDAISPSTVSLMGVTFQFSEGAELNEYSIKIGDVSSSKIEAKVNKADNEIILNGNFLDKGAVAASDLEEAVNKALAKEKIKQTVKTTGMLSTLGQLKSTADESGKDAKAPKELEIGGLSIKFELKKENNEFIGQKGAQLNGYGVSVKNDTSITSNPPVMVKINKDTKSIEIVGNLDDTKLDAAKIQTAINSELQSKGIGDIEISEVTKKSSVGGAGTISEGVDLQSSKTLNIGGLNITLPKGELFNNVEVVVEEIDGQGLKNEKGVAYDVPKFVDIKTTTVGDKKVPTKIRISADFRTPTVEADQLADKINEAIKESKLYGDAKAELKDEKKVKITGTSKILTGLSTSTIYGGTDFKEPTDAGNFKALGMNFNFTKGAALNGYKIVIGNVSEGTKTSAEIDEKDKVITVNGDFVTQGATSVKMVNSALRQALEDKGIRQNILVTGNIQPISSGVKSAATDGGTPVESLGESGELQFVDGTKPLKSYDTTLKTLRIPDKIKVPGTNEELKVNSYTIDETGIINCMLEGGSVAAVGQLAIASFKNPEGLTKNGGNLYSRSSNSGNAIIKSGVGTTEPGSDNSKGYGTTLQGKLEMSNVDLAQQFSDMIVTNRSFQASGKMISTGDEILQDIINLKR